MDYFKEAEWFFDEVDKQSWYENVYQPLVVGKRRCLFNTSSPYSCPELDLIHLHRPASCSCSSPFGTIWGTDYRLVRRRYRCLNHILLLRSL